jgi:hypothetical protein
VSVEEVERGCFLPCMIPSCVPRKRKNEVWRPENEKSEAFFMEDLNCPTSIGYQ